MRDNKNLILVDSRVLPSVFPKVLEIKKMMKTGKAKTVTEAAAEVGISRSAFYKYKDCVFPFHDMKGILTLSFELMDIAGILSQILSILAKAKCNILTINQNVPINGVANITVTVQTEQMRLSTDKLISGLQRVRGVRKVNILAKQ